MIPRMPLRRLLGIAAGLWLLAASASPVLGGWWDDLDKGERVRLADVVADPGPLQGKTITFPCVFRAMDEVYFPYFTSFTREKHLNLSVWLDGAPIWERESYAKDEFPFVYLGRDHPQRDEALRLAPFTRVEVTGKVKDVFRGKPWIEVAAFRVAPATLGREVVEWVKSGDAHAARGDYARAETFYGRALAEVTLEETYALRIRQRRGQVLRAAGKDEEAAKAEGGPIVGGTPIPAADPRAAPIPPRSETPAPPPPAGDTFPTDPLPGRAPPAAPPPSETAPVTPAAKPSALTSDLPGVPYSAGPKPAPPPTPVPPAARPPSVPPKSAPPPAVAPPVPAVAPKGAAPSPSGSAAAPGKPLPPPPPPGPCEPVAPAPSPKTPPAAKAPEAKPPPTPAKPEKTEPTEKPEKKDTEEPVSPPAPPPRVPRLSGVR